MRTVMVMGALVLLLIVASSAAIMPTMAGGCIASYRTVVGQAYPKGPNILSHPRNSSATDCCSLCKTTAGCAGWSFLAGTHRICHVANAAAKLVADKTPGVVSGVGDSPVRLGTILSSLTSSTISTFELHALCMYADVLIHAFFVLPFTNGTGASCTSWMMY